MEEGKVYHVYNRGNNKENIFKEWKNYYYFLRLCRSYLKDYVEVLAYCLMPNHFHFMIRVKAGKGLINSDDGTTSKCQVGEQFRRLFIAYSQAINKEYGRTGSLFQKRFKKIEVEEESYFTVLMAYIHLNPVKANLVASCGDWKFSSFNTIIEKSELEPLYMEIMNWFNGKDAFIQFHKAYGDWQQEVLDDLQFDFS